MPLIIAQTWDKNFFQPFTGVALSRTAKVLTHPIHFLCTEYVEMYEYAGFCAHNIDKGWQTFHHLVPDFREKVPVVSGASHPCAIIILMKLLRYLLLHVWCWFFNSWLLYTVFVLRETQLAHILFLGHLISDFMHVTHASKE